MDYDKGLWNDLCSGLGRQRTTVGIAHRVGLGSTPTVPLTTKNAIT